MQKLHIENYAIIDEIEIEFSPKLSIITGETGAGKSILIGALSLILGERADTSVLLHSNKKCVVEGHFQIQNKDVQEFLTQNELNDENEDELVLRREIASTGKSRGFINDIPATLQQLKILTSLLVDLHQQFDTLELGDSDFQRKVVDALAGNNALLKNYQVVFNQWQHIKSELAVLTEQKNNFNKEFDYHQFLFNELSEAAFSENELENLDAELKMLGDSENIKTALSKVYFELKEKEQPVVQTLKQLFNQLNAYAPYHGQISSLNERLRSAQIEIQDIAEEADQINSSIQYDLQRIEWINERLSAGYKLQKKHNVTTTNELLQVQCVLEEKLKAVLHIDEEIAAKEKESIVLYGRSKELAEEISAARKKQAAPLEKQINALLAKVGMPNALLKVAISETSLNAFGKDNIEFLFDANKSNRFEPLRKVASGGELSRLMLCIKSLVAESIDLPTLIFDEIDTGISGEAARQVGIIMKALSANRQVICITHQPQIAGKADAHFFVYKEKQKNVIVTKIKQLSQDERVQVIAQMLSGEKPTNAALQNAKEMVME